jgi:hypothetical protein
MKSLLTIASLASIAAWVLWELLPVRYSYFSPSHDQPYQAFLIESLIALVVTSLLLLIVIAVQRQVADELVPWFQRGLVQVQLGVCAGAGVSGVYAAAQLRQMLAQLGGNLGSGDPFWFSTGPVAIVAGSPWLVFIAAAVLAGVARSVGRAQAAAMIAFDVLALVYVAFVFAHVHSWACVSCSGPAG